MTRSQTALLLILVLLTIVPVAQASGERTFALCVHGPQDGFMEIELESTLYHELIAHPRVDLISPQIYDSVCIKQPEYASTYFDPDLMLDMAQALNSRYIAWMAIEESNVRQKARTWIPYIFRSYHRKCVLGVRLYVVDSYSGETVLARYYEEDRPGPAVLSQMDFDPNDVGLMQSYTEVAAKFRELEEDMSEKIAEELIKVTYKR